VPTKIPWRPPESSFPKRVSLHHQIAGRIGSLIGGGSLAPGVVLPNESKLGDEFRVSRTVLREAIKVLAAKGLLEVRRKTGTRVRPHGEWNMLDPEVLSWSFSGSGLPAGLADLVEVRKVVEPAAARMAAERGSSEDYAEIEAACEAMEAASNDLPSSIEPDLRFHLGILEATHNVFMRPFGALIQTALRASFRLTSTTNNRIAYRRSVALHRKVVEAIKAGNGRKAEMAMAAVLVQTSRDIEARLRTNSSKAGSKVRKPRYSPHRSNPQ
jgi:DNA-binding FadR family transcriptional regulator